MNNSEILNRIKAARIKQAEQEKREEEEVTARNSEYLERLKKAREKQQVTAVVGAEKEKARSRSGLASVGLDESKVKRSSSVKELSGTKALDVTPSFVKESGDDKKNVAYKDFHGTTHFAKDGIPAAFNSSSANDVLKNEKLREKVTHSSNPVFYAAEKLLTGIENARAGTQEAIETLVEGINNIGLDELNPKTKDKLLLEIVADSIKDTSLKNAQESDNALDKSKAYSERVSEKYKSIENTAGGKVVGDLAYNVGRMLPNVLLGSAAGKLATVGQAIDTVKSADVARRLAQTVTAITMSGVYGNESVKTAKDAGASDEDAIAYGIMNGIIQGAGEQALGGIMGTGASRLATTKLASALGKHVTNPILRTVGRYGAGVAEEALEEIVQDTLDTLAQKATYNEEAELDAMQLAYSGFMGGLLGGIGAIPSSISGTRAAIGQMRVIKDVASAVQEIENEADVAIADSMIGELVKSVEYLQSGEKYIVDENKKAQFKDLADYTERELGKIKTAVEMKRNELTAQSVDAEAGNSTAADAVKRIEERAEDVIKSGSEKAEAMESLDRLAAEVESSERLTDAQKGVINQAVETAKVRMQNDDVQMDREKAVRNERAEKATSQIAETSELTEEIGTADAEAGNAIARTVVTDLYDRANKMLEGKFDLERATVELDRTADNVRSNEGLLEGQKSAILKAVENVRERLTVKAESAETRAETNVIADVSPEVKADREARASKATSELQKSGILAGATDEQIEEVRAITEIFRKHGSSINVRFASDMEVAGGTVNGKYESATNTIFVNPKAKNPFAQVIAHEIVHRMANNNSDLYSEFVKAVTTFYASKGKNLDELAKSKVAEYATYGIQLSEKQSVEEVAAEFVETYIHDKQAIRSLVRKHRSVAEWLRIKLRGLLGWLKPEQTREARYLQDALDILSQEMRGVDSNGMTAKDRELKALGDQYADGEITGEEYDRKIAEIEEEGEDNANDSVTEMSQNEIDRSINESGEIKNDNGDVVALGSDDRHVSRTMNDNVSYSISLDNEAPVSVEAPTEAEQTTLALDEEDAKVAVPYEDEEGNLRFTSITELTPEEESLYGSMPLMDAAFDESDVKVFAEENEKLKRSVEYLKGQFKVTRGYVPQKQAVRRMIRQIASDYSAKGIDVNGLADRVIAVAKNMNDGKIDAREAYDRYVNIAKAIIDAQEIQTNPLYEEYAELRNYLRNTAISLDEQYRGDFDDFGGWNDFRNGVMGIMKLSNDGISVDTAYDEISGMFTGLLDEGITNPADRMKELARLAKSLRAVYENTYTDEMAESEAASLGAIIGAKVSELPEAKTYADRMKDARYRAAQNVRDAYRVQMERIKKRAQERLEAMELYFKNREAARELAEKRRKEEKIRRDRSRGKYVSLDKIEEALADGSFASKMRAVHQKLKKYRKAITVAKDAGYTPDIDKYTELAENTVKYIEAVGRKLRQMRDRDSRTAYGKIQEWEGKEGFLGGLRYATETPTRIIEDIAPNKEAGKRLLAYAFDPVRKNEANRQRWIKELRDRVKALNIGTKKVGKNANTESEAVQIVGEYTHIIGLLKGKRRLYGMNKAEWEQALDEFEAANPEMNWSEVDRKTKAMREIYDEIYEELSDVLVTNGYPPVNKRAGYFPHFSENEPDSVLGKAAAAIGLKVQGNELPTSIYGLTATFKPGKSYFGNLNKRTGNNTTYDALQGFELYINGASNVIHHTEDIQRLRSLARVIRQDSASPETKKKIEDLANARDGLTQEQKDLQINEIMRDARYNLAGFVSWLDEYTNGLANKKSKYDRSMEELMGRTIYSLASQLESRIAANMVALNPGSWLTNFIPLAQAGALIDGKYMLKAAAMAVANARQDDGFTDKSDFLVSRMGSDPVIMALSDRVSSFMSRPMEWIDNFAAQTIVRARYMQNVEKHGMSEDAAMAEANVFAGKVMADRSKGSTPTIFNSKNPLIKTFTMFQIEQNNQLRYLFKDIPRETEEAKRAGLALVAALMKYAVGAYLFNDIYEHYLGRRPAFDIIGILNNTVGSAVGYKLPNILDAIEEVIGDAVKGEMKKPGEYLKTKKRGIVSAFGEGGTELIENLPFVGGVVGGGRLPIGNAIGNPFEVAGEALAMIPTVDEETGEIVQNGSWQRLLKTAYDELTKPVYYMLPKFGGGQAKKMIEGTIAVAQQGSYAYNKKGEAQLQYPLTSDNFWEGVLNWAGASIFGKTTTPWAREWIVNNFKTRTVGETSAYKALIEIGEQPSDAYAILDEIKEAKAEHAAKSKKGNSPYTSGTEAALATLKKNVTLSEISKAQVYKHLLASPDEKEYLYGTIRYQDPALYKVLTAIRKVSTDGKVSAKIQKQNLILDSDLSDAAKIKVYRVKAASEKEEDFMDDMIKQGVSEMTTMKVLTKAGSATRNSGKYKAVSTTSMNEAQRNAFMKQIMTDDQYSKYNLANKKGITTAVWAQFTERLETVNESGAASQDEVKMALAGMNITQNQKAAIWQLQNKSWKAESNPFNPTVGRLIKEQME